MKHYITILAAEESTPVGEKTTIHNESSTMKLTLTATDLQGLERLNGFTIEDTTSDWLFFHTIMSIEGLKELP